MTRDDALLKVALEIAWRLGPRARPRGERRYRTSGITPLPLAADEDDDARDLRRRLAALKRRAGGWRVPA